MKITEEFLKELLVDSNIIDQRDFDLAKKEAKEKNESLENLLIEKGLISDQELGQLIADEIGFPFVNLRKLKIDREILEIVPEVIAKKQEIIVFKRTKNGLGVAMTQPENLEFREFIERKTGEKVVPYFSTKKQIGEALKYYGKEIKEEFEEIIKKSAEKFKKTKILPALPIIKILNLILNHGYNNRASDIHLEPYSQKVILRYRIDGVLHDILSLPKEIHDSLVSRVKILANLRTDVSNLPQEGHFNFEAPAERVDIRVSIVPIEEGEKVVFRILSLRTKMFTLYDLGLSSEGLKILEQNTKKPWGMIIAAGPTGCGKTTTLYAILETLNVRKLNIMSIEDPIEYDIEGINQIQVDPKIGLTFAKGLRAILRQDPNIIMVGEMRDRETAKLSIDAAMTGHLVLSTFHAIDASAVLTRLLDMEIEPFLITSTINLLIAQRLVRKNCRNCIESYELPFSKISDLIGEELAQKLPQSEKGKVRLYRGRGCDSCQKTGYQGRIGIFELLEIKEPIKKLIMARANASQIKAEAKRLGMSSMFEDGLKKVELGITTIDEIFRVLR